MWSLFTHSTADGAELTLLRDYLDRAGPRLDAFEFAAAGEHAGMGAYAYLHDLGAAGPPEALVPPRDRLVADGVLRDNDAVIDPPS